MYENIAEFKKVSAEQYEKDLLKLESDSKLRMAIYDAVEKVYKSIRLPERATVGSAGYDFLAPFQFSLEPGETITVPTGIRCKMETGFVLMVFPRSGHGFKCRAQLDNTVGIIDQDYYCSDNEGHIMLKITNDGHEGKILSVNAGDGFAQGIFLPFGTIVNDHASGIRNGGMGSTTK